MEQILDSQERTDELELNNGVLLCAGSWTVFNQASLQDQWQILLGQKDKVSSVDISSIEKMDSAGALFLLRLVQMIFPEQAMSHITGLSKRNQLLLELVDEQLQGESFSLAPQKKNPIFYRLGRWFCVGIPHVLDFFSFVGALVFSFAGVIKNFRRLRLKSVFKIIETSGSMALPIVGMMTFLIGFVLVYQLGVQLKIYGATIFVVEVSGKTMLREFSPLITAVVIAGRTSTSFAALLGSMKVNQEIDALQTMGFPPIESLVLPRIIGLFIALPLLIVWADFMGTIGSMVMTKAYLGISFSAFFSRYSTQVGVNNFILGLVKAPIFALIIATVGCYQGFKVDFGAESVGRNTTKAAVHSIFLIIVADAVFSVIFSFLGL